MDYTVGIDAGSAAIKAVALGATRPLAFLQEATGASISQQCETLLEKLLASAPVRESNARLVCATGYGRKLVKSAGIEVSEILANALGVGLMWRNWGALERIWGQPPHPPVRPARFRTIVDIGGQDSKAITFTADGLVNQFAMNSRCAAGTGRFLEVMARVLETDLAGLDRLALSCAEPAVLSSTCTVFAESEVISLLSEGAARESVAAGIFQGVADRAAELARQIEFEHPVLLDGGPAHSISLRKALARALGGEVAVPPAAEFTTALGAALYAAREDGAEGESRG